MLKHIRTECGTCTNDDVPISVHVQPNTVKYYRSDLRKGFVQNWLYMYIDIPPISRFILRIIRYLNQGKIITLC